tara:strand:- start:21 stop:830 length:810 start_codon:yes stop_codon:yes gene_type:complete
MIAALLVFYMKKGHFKIGYYPPLTPFITPLFLQSKTSKISKKESYETKVVTSFMDKLKKDFFYFILSLHHSIKDFRSFQHFGLNSKIVYTYLLDLSNMDEFWKNLGKDVKYDIKKSKERGTEVYISDNIDRFYNLYEDTCKRQNIPLIANKQLIQEMMLIKDSKMFFAKNNEGQDIASSIVIFDHKRAYYLLAAHDSRYKDHKASSLLLWEIIKHVSKKRNKMDLVGANTPSVAKFKSSFNPKLVPYIQAEYYSSFLAKILIGIYRMVR